MSGLCFRCFILWSLWWNLTPWSLMMLVNHIVPFLGPANVFSGRGGDVVKLRVFFCWHLLLDGPGWVFQDTKWWERMVATGLSIGLCIKGEWKGCRMLSFCSKCVNTLLIFAIFITEIQNGKTPSFWGLFSFNLDQIIGFFPCFLGLPCGSNTGWPPRVRLRGLPFGAHEVRIATKPQVGHLKWVV